MSADPIGQHSDVNLYAYTFSNPINYVDPHGLNAVAEFAINTNQGLAAFADGAIPFFDPFAAGGAYDPCDPTLEGSKFAGSITAAVEAGLLTYGLLFGFGPIGATAAAEGAGSGVNEAADAIQEFLGGPGEVKRNDAGDPIIMKDDRKVRFDANDPHGDEAHFHLEEKTPDGRWRDAGPKHRYYFKKD